MKISDNINDISVFVVRLDIGDEIISSIEDVAKKRDINSGVFKGIGALENVTVGYFDKQTKKYKKETYESPHELLNVTGFITTKNDEVHVHAHAVLADDVHTAIGGHLHKGYISAAGEVEITQFLNETISREHIPETGLDILDM